MDTMNLTPKKINALKPLAAAVLGSLSVSAYAAKVEVTPLVDAGVTYTDNVNLEGSDTETSTVGTTSAGLKAKVKGNGGSVDLTYKGTQAFYSHDSDRNDFFNELNFSAKNKLGRSGFSGKVNADISEVARSQARNANNDFLTGDTVSNRNAGVGVDYTNGNRGNVGIKGGVDAKVRDAADDEGNSYSYGANLDLSDGRQVDNYFWSANYDYDRDESREDDRYNQSHRIQGKLGLAQYEGFAPFLDYRGEQYDEKGRDGDADRERKYASVGPGLRYYIDRRSYFELTYNHVVEGDQDDYWGGKVNLKPTPRTTIYFEYEQRFFGDSYTFRLKHRSKRWTNSINYRETPSSFDREFFSGDEDLANYSINRTLDWTSSLALKRGSFSVSIRAQEKERDDNDDGKTTNDDSYGVNAKYSHQLTRTTRLSASANYDQYKFDRTVGDDQKDYYRTFELRANHSFRKSLSIDYGYRFANRSSNIENFKYDENRVFANLTKRF
ncbi:TIGR03016 family PEP-CTERM system-associated outer membrane protein [Echinimonas agarilytica]|uniref:TIGR03016 family PEP-CTERM system-associated outer membrane protein n=1 Tax=Echinimonas agarilytica TaxID=1215918 RepID=A0AA41WAD3_9GAMM|nr:TIGR03016 family PEP-CTERM system-associated outer membrane protein [Echinimonas agarilytica]MCM2681466.1 TIGR03016 family PEP-CTERM system-associated outer membrane protein [Echinimonas agarilytica]